MSLVVIPLYIWALFVFLLPGFAVLAGLSLRNRAPRPLVAQILLIAAGATVGYLAFWVYFRGTAQGRFFTFAVQLASLALVTRGLFNSRTRALFREVGVPLFYVAAIGLCYISLLYIEANPFLARDNLMNWRFFTATRPGDNIIPMILAEKLYHRLPVVPFCCGDWLSSDRPPLQTGIFLFSWPLQIIHSTNLIYQLLGTCLQCLWVCGVWAILVALGAPAARFRQVLALMAPSAFLLYNTLYPWPKLLAAAFLFFVFAILIAALREGRALTRGELALASTCLGLALMSHPGSVFSLPCFVILALYRRIFKWRELGWAVLILCCFTAPWAAYQKYVDPPGNRLMKMHLAGVIGVDPRGTWETIRDSYRKITLARIVENKFDNMIHIIGPHPFSGLDLRDPHAPRDFDAVDYREALRVDQREYIWDALGFLVLGWLVVPIAVIRKLRPAIPYSGWLLAVGAINMLVWSLIVFGPFATVTTHSSYADALLWMIGLSGYILMLPRWVQALVVILIAASTAIVWIPFTPHSPNFPSQIQWPLVCFGALSSILLLTHFLYPLFKTEVRTEQARENLLPGKISESHGRAV